MYLGILLSGSNGSSPSFKKISQCKRESASAKSTEYLPQSLVNTPSRRWLQSNGLSLATSKAKECIFCGEFFVFRGPNPDIQAITINDTGRYQPATGCPRRYLVYGVMKPHLGGNTSCPRPWPISQANEYLTER